MSFKNNEFLKLEKWLPTFFKAYLLFTLLFLLMLIIGNASSGFDITDESFYLIWATRPDNVVGHASHFGYITSLLFQLCHKNIETFRVCGLLLLVGAALIFVVCLNKYWSSRSIYINSADSYYWTTLPALIAVLVYYRSWVVTPSYNWLALVSSLIAGSGLLYATVVKKNDENIANTQLLLGAVLVGTGGALAFIAKPTTAIILGMTCFFWLSMHFNIYLIFKFILLSVTCFLIVMGAHIFGNFTDVNEYVHNLSVGLEFRSILKGGGNSLLSVFYASFNQFMEMIWNVLTWWVFIAALGIVLMLKLLEKIFSENGDIKKFPIYLIIGLLVIATTQLITSVSISSANTATASISVSFFLLVLLLVIYYFFAALIPRAGVTVKNIIALNILFILLAVSVSFGTANSLISHMATSYIFLALGLIFLGRWINIDKKEVLFSWLLPIGVSVVATLVLLNAFNHPYRLVGGMVGQDSKVSFLSELGTLKVDPVTSEYINSLKESALKSGWQEGNLLIDLTGATPGATVILNAGIIAKPWLFGGYKGSNAFAKRALSFATPKQLKHSWLLIAPRGYRRLSLALLAESGIDFPNNYILVSQVRTGYRNEIQQLWRPKLRE